MLASNTPVNNPPNVNAPSSANLQIDIHDATGLPAALHRRLDLAIRRAAAHLGYTTGSLGLAVVDDPAIHKINRQHLDHDYPTDVISFGYHRASPTVEGELVVSVDTARREADELGWTLENELLLYAIHGTLHICGLEDGTDAQRREMRQAEHAVLQELGVADAARYSPDPQPVDRSPPASGSEATS